MFPVGAYQFESLTSQTQLTTVLISFSVMHIDSNPYGLVESDFALFQAVPTFSLRTRIVVRPGLGSG